MHSTARTIPRNVHTYTDTLSLPSLDPKKTLLTGGLWGYVFSPHALSSSSLGTYSTHSLSLHPSLHITPRDMTIQVPAPIPVPTLFLLLSSALFCSTVPNLIFSSIFHPFPRFYKSHPFPIQPSFFLPSSRHLTSLLSQLLWLLIDSLLFHITTT